MGISDLSISRLLVEILLNCFDSWFVVTLSTYHISRLSVRKRLYMHGAWVGLALLLTVFQLLPHSELMTVYFLPLLIFAYAVIVNSKNRLQGLLCGVTSYLLVGIVNFFSAAIVLYFYDLQFEDVFIANSYRVQVLIICKLIQLLIWLYIYSRNRISDPKEDNFSNYNSAVRYSAFIFICILFVDRRIINEYTVSNLLFILFLYCIVSELVDRKVKKEKLAQEEKFIKEKLAHEEKLFNVTRSAHAEVADILKTLSLSRNDAFKILKMFLQLKEVSTLDEMRERLSQAESALTGFLQKVNSTGNTMIDEMLLNKSYHVAHVNIGIEVTGEIKENCGVSSEDLALIVFHLVRVAELELRTAKYRDKEEIYLSFNNDEAGLQIEIAYSKFAEAKKINASFALVKVTQLIESYHGKITSQTDDGLCTIKVLFPRRSFSEMVDYSYNYELACKGGD